jgi:hypothetical protein
MARDRKRTKTSTDHLTERSPRAHPVLERPLACALACN